MPTKYRFVTSGDYVEFYDDAMLVTTIHNTSRNVSWMFNQTEGIIFSINGYEYHTDNVSDISFDGTALTTQAGFVAGVQGMFPGLAGGGSTLDQVIVAGNALEGDRQIAMGDFSLGIYKGEEELLEVTQETSKIRSHNTAGNSSVKTRATGDEASFEANANFNVSGKGVGITGTVTADDSILEHEADKHKFNNIQEFADNAAAIVGGLEEGMVYRTADVFKIVH